MSAAWKDPRGGTYEIDRRFRGVGRIRRASGTTHGPTFKALNAMLDALYTQGRTDLLIGLRDVRALQPLAVLAAYRANRLADLPSAETLVPLAPAWAAFIAGHDGAQAEQRRHYALTLARLLECAATPEPTIAEVPGLLAALRERRRLDGTARAFNHDKSNAQAFLRHTLKRTHPLYAAALAVDRLKVTAKRAKRPMTPAEVDTLGRALVAQSQDAARGTEAAALLAVMCCTGMGPKELWGDWTVQADRIHIAGTKRKGRVRDVPRVWSVGAYVRPVLLSEKALRQRVERVSAATIGARSLYDCRRTFANWLEDAGIPRTRRKAYLGHGAGDVTDLYEARDVSAYLRRDGEDLRRLIGDRREASTDLPGKVPGATLRVMGEDR